MGKVHEGEREARLPVAERVSHGSKRHSTGTAVSGVVIVFCGGSWCYTCGQHSIV